MFDTLKKLFSLRKPRPKTNDPDDMITEKWNADFTKPESLRFDIKSENSYDAYLRPDSLVLGLRKSNCIVWVEDPQYRYGDQIIGGKIRLNAHGAYAAAGFMFRMVDERTYYSVLISNKGYFRLDVLRNGMPFPLIGWTEVPDGSLGALPSPGTGIVVEPAVIAYGNHILLVINGHWAAEIHDATIPLGRICFTAASYEPPSGEGSPYTAEAFLEAFSVDSRIEEVEARYEQWTVMAEPSSRFHLAETFAAMGQPVPALIQLKKAWENRDYPGTQRELLLAARLALGLELFGDAEEYINACISGGADTPEGRDARTEKAKLLYKMERYGELKAYGEEGAWPDATLYTLLGHVYLGLNEFENAARVYDRAFELDSENGLPAKNAAKAYELLDRKAEALERYLEAGRVFLSQENYQDLGLLIPQVLSLGAARGDAHGLAGKWAFGVEDWAMAAKELAEAEELQERMGMPKDPAVVFLRGLLLVREGKRRDALALLEEAAALAPDYALFRFRLAENRFLLSGDSEDPKLIADMEAAMEMAPEDGWIVNLAAQIALTRGDLESASAYLEKAALSLGEVPAIRVNRGVLYYLRGSLDKALSVLSADKDEDPQGLMTNCAGNLLVRSGRYEEADEYYRQALSIAPDNLEYLCNRASCLIELGLLGEADGILAQVHHMSPQVLELIAYVSIKKGEYPRAKAACTAALEMEPRHVPSLLSLGWLYSSAGQWDKTEEVLLRLDELITLGEEDAARKDELRSRLEDARTKRISCAACDRAWRVPRELEPVPPLRFFAMPPDDLPAGTCPQCGKTYCIGCGKQKLDTNSRFLCPQCGKTLKLTDQGLKKLVYDWASQALPARE
jgi:tetratricopeptide (TPR) repeat protein